MTAWFQISFPTATAVAELSENVAEGLAGRISLGQDEGMLFDMGANAMHGFWMRGVLIPLDIVFIYAVDTASGVVTGIVPNAQPGDETMRFGSGGVVLEVAGGWCQRRGVRIGQHVDFSPTDRQT